MNITKVIKTDKATIVHLDLVVDGPEKLGKLKITKRWEAAGKSLKSQLEIPQDQNLIQIDVGLTDDHWIRTQDFIFYYG